MIQGEFEGTEGAKAIGFSHSDFGFVVQALFDATGKQLVRAKIVEDQLAVLAQRPASPIRYLAVDLASNFLAELPDRPVFQRMEGWHPFCIVANAGSVHTGAVDPLSELASVASESGLWLHVDGAYGAAAILDPNCAALFAGIRRADSVALDPHKWLSVPVECGCVLVRDGSLLRDAFSLIPPYVRTEPGKGIGNLPWFAEFGFQQTRGFRALKLWVTLAHAGTLGLKEQISRQIALARYMEQRIEALPDFELRSKGKLSIVCFRYLPREFAGNEEALDALNKKVMERMQSDGTAFVTNTTLAGRFVLRACILHYGTMERDVDTMLQAVQDTATQLLKQQTAGAI